MSTTTDATKKARMATALVRRVMSKQSEDVLNYEAIEYIWLEALYFIACAGGIVKDIDDVVAAAEKFVKFLNECDEPAIDLNDGMGPQLPVVPQLLEAMSNYIAAKEVEDEGCCGSCS